MLPHDPHAEEPDDLCDRDCERCGADCPQAGRDMEMERVEHDVLMNDN